MSRSGCGVCGQVAQIQSAVRPVGGGAGSTGTDTQTHKHRHTNTDTDTDTQIQTQTHTHTQTWTPTHTHACKGRCMQRGKIEKTDNAIVEMIC